MNSPAHAVPALLDPVVLELPANCTYRRLLRLELCRFPEKHANVLFAVLKIRNATVAGAHTGDDLRNAILRSASILILGARFDLTAEEVQTVRDTFAPHGLRIEIEEARTP